jgi:hypothetical protein
MNYEDASISEVRIGDYLEISLSSSKTIRGQVVDGGDRLFWLHTEDGYRYQVNRGTGNAMCLTTPEQAEKNRVRDDWFRISPYAED